jgi:hypothetical protein
VGISSWFLSGAGMSRIKKVGFVAGSFFFIYGTKYLIHRFGF